VLASPEVKGSEHTLIIDVSDLLTQLLLLAQGEQLVHGAEGARSGMEGLLGVVE